MKRAFAKAARTAGLIALLWPALGLLLPGPQGRETLKSLTTPTSPAAKASTGTSAGEVARDASVRRRIRNQLLAIHGFSRSGLEGAGGDVSAALRAFISDPAETMVVKRQAVKALGLFPTELNFEFIQGRLDAASLGLGRLYVRALQSFSATRPGEITGLLETLLADPDVTLRHSAASLAATLPDGPRLRTLLRKRLVEEPDGSVRGALLRILSR